MTIFDESGKEIMSSVSEVVELSNTTLAATLFDVPADYREVKDRSELYASLTGSANERQTISDAKLKTIETNNSGDNQNFKNMANDSGNSKTEPGAKKAGVVRVGMTSVKYRRNRSRNQRAGTCRRDSKHSGRILENSAD
jgi:hypothetical protein